jgi:hypothetical protein
MTYKKETLPDLMARWSRDYGDETTIHSPIRNEEVRRVIKAVAEMYNEIYDKARFNGRLTQDDAEKLLARIDGDEL